MEDTTGLIETNEDRTNQYPKKVLFDEDNSPELPM